MLCSSCHTLNRAGAAFCVQCGAEIGARRRPSIPLSLIKLLALVLALVLSCSALAFSPLGQRVDAIAEFFNRFGGEPTVATRDAVVLGVQSMSQLATAKATIQTIVDVEDQGFFGPLTHDRILLRADADVLAGIDLSAVTADQIQIERDHATIALPPPMLVSTDISYQVYDRQRGWFAATNKDLQSLAEQQARTDIIAIACDKGLLRDAQANAETTLRALLLQLGLKQVTFQATPPDVATCKP